MKTIFLHFLWYFVMGPCVSIKNNILSSVLMGKNVILLVVSILILSLHAEFEQNRGWMILCSGEGGYRWVNHSSVEIDAFEVFNIVWKGPRLYALVKYKNNGTTIIYCTYRPLKNNKSNPHTGDSFILHFVLTAIGV